MKVTMKVHYPTAEELVEDRDAVSLIKYIINCYSDGFSLKGEKLHGMMDRMYLYNWSIAGIMMYRKITTEKQIRLEDLKKLESDLYNVKGSTDIKRIIDDIKTEILGIEGSLGLNDISDFCEYEFFLTDYGIEIFMNVLKLEARKTRRFMTTKELQTFSDSGRLEMWLLEPKSRKTVYKKSHTQEEADFALFIKNNKEYSDTIHNIDEKGVVGWLSPKGNFSKCGWAEHSLTAYNILKNTEYDFDDAEQKLEQMGYIKFWKMMDSWGAGGSEEVEVNKDQIKWFERNIDILADHQIKMFEKMIKK